MAFLIPENLRSRRDIPPAIGLVARALQEGLDDAATVWYEPLFDVGGERPDLVVLVPDAGVLVIEVLDAKPSATVAAGGRRLRVSGGQGPCECDDPLRRAEMFATELAARVEKDPGLVDTDRLPVVALGVLAYLSRDHATAEALRGAGMDPRLCLFRDDLELGRSDPAAFARQVAARMEAPLRERIGERAERVYRSLIHPDTVIGHGQLEFRDAAGATMTETGDIKVLDRAQEAVAKTLGTGHRVIWGVAGSGKTLVLLYRARLLARLSPSARILVTCYNRSLAGVLRRELADLPRVRVATIETLMNEALRSADAAVPDLRTPMEERAAQALSALAVAASRRPVRRYQHVLVDEAQDFTTDALRFAVGLLAEGCDSLLVVADGTQNMYGRRIVWSQAGIAARGRTRRLTRSYRNTRETLDYAWRFVTADGSVVADAGGDLDLDTSQGVVPPDASERHGKVPTFLYLPSPAQEVVAIADHCRALIASGVAPGDIAVLYGSRRAASFNWPESLLTALGSCGLQVFWATDPASRSNRDRFGEDRAAITLSTMHSAKGLEWPHVVLCGYLEDTPPERRIMNRRILYVGMTRAIDHLVLTASGRHEYIADLES